MMLDVFALDPTTHPLALNFVHSRVIGGLTGFLEGGPLGAVRGIARGDGRGAKKFTGADPGAGLGGRSCPPGSAPDRFGQCADTRSPGTVTINPPFTGDPGIGVSIARGGGGGGERFAGHAGLPATEPAAFSSVTLRCAPGMVLGRDELCYQRGGKFGITNGQRKWPRGTRPFLSGGDVKCLRRANSLRSSKSNKTLLKELGLGG